MKFVDQIADYIFERDIDLRKLVIVLPSERMKKYVASALFRRYGRPLISPEMVTIDNWIKRHSDKTVIDRTRTLLALYEIHLSKIKSDEDRSFDEFLSWGEILLNDFNEIDRYLLDAEQIFRNLEDVKQIENWSFNSTELTEGQKKFMEFWEKLPDYYRSLNAKLDAQGWCYTGKAFREAAEDISRFFKLEKEQQFLFAGFNALSASELSIIRQLDQMGRAHILIDADLYYYRDPSHEAGRFLHELIVTLDNRELSFIQDSLLKKSLDIELVNCAQNTGQVKVAATKLASLSQSELDETLLFLADENLIVSMMKNLPATIGKANITLGLPIRNTAIKTWVELLFSIQENKSRFRTEALYHIDSQNLLNHPFVQSIISEEDRIRLQEAEMKAIRKNQIFIKKETYCIGEGLTTILEQVTKRWEQKDWQDTITVFRELNAFIYSRLSEDFSFERAIIERFDQALSELENLVKEGIPEMTLRSFRHLFNQHWQSQSIAYHGNPQKGLQIMGLLETRGLDFKRIICIGMNEGNLPPTNPVQTLIPMDLRRFYGLPSPREKQGLFAHHFYRLLHHCEEMLVTYCSAEESIGVNEPSRYLLQIEKELSRRNPDIRLNKKVYSLEMKKQHLHLSIEKTEEISQRLDDLFARSTSASMLKKYLECPLDFYFRYIMDFGEVEEVEEEVEHNTFGTFIHGTLEELYEPFARFDRHGVKKVSATKNITSFDVEEMLKLYPKILTEQFREHFNNDDEAFSTGKNLLSYKMATELIDRFLRSEIIFLSKQTEPVFIESLERKYEHELELDIFGENKKVRLSGYIDRIDRIGEKVRIIDYKTGKVAPADVSFLATGEDRIKRSLLERKHVLQLVQYAYLFREQEKKLPEVSIVSFISGSFEPFTMDTKNDTLIDIVEDFPLYLKELITEIYDPEIPFEHKDRFQSYCKYCQ